MSGHLHETKGVLIPEGRGFMERFAYKHFKDRANRNFTAFAKAQKVYVKGRRTPI